MIKCYAFKFLDSGIDVDTVSVSEDDVRIKTLQLSMGWRFNHPDRYNLDEAWANILTYGELVEVQVVEVKETDDGELISSDWVAANFPSMGPQYSARQRDDIPCITWQNRFERFVLYGNPQLQLKTRGDVRRLVAALGYMVSLNELPRDGDVK